MPFPFTLFGHSCQFVIRKLTRKAWLVWTVIVPKSDYPRRQRRLQRTISTQARLAQTLHQKRVNMVGKGSDRRRLSLTATFRVLLTSATSVRCPNIQRSERQQCFESSCCVPKWPIGSMIDR